MTEPLDDSPHARAQRAYHARQKERGIVRVSVYIPRQHRDDFDRNLTRLRRKWEREAITAD